MWGDVRWSARARGHRIVVKARTAAEAELKAFHQGVLGYCGETSNDRRKIKDKRLKGFKPETLKGTSHVETHHQKSPTP